MRTASAQELLPQLEPELLPQLDPEPQLEPEPEPQLDPEPQPAPEPHPEPPPPLFPAELPQPPSPGLAPAHHTVGTSSSPEESDEWCAGGPAGRIRAAVTRCARSAGSPMSTAASASCIIVDRSGGQEK